MKKLNQVIAIEKDIKSRAMSLISEAHKISQKPDLFNGFSKKYQPKDEEGEQFPDEKKKVICSYGKQLEIVRLAFTKILDITLTKDVGNCDAKINLEIDGLLIGENIPATFLLTLEKNIIDIRTFINELPTLDESENWIYDVNSDEHKTESISTHKTKKTTRPIVLYEATKEHPAQVQLVNEDVVIGYWETVKSSGAIPLSLKQKMLTRLEKLSHEVKSAREKANSTEITDKYIGNAIFDYLFK